MSRVLITGGSRGLGLAICRRLLEEGRQVVTTSRCGSDELRRLAREFPGRLEHVTADLAERGAVRRLARAARLLDGLEGLVANAGVGTEGLLTLTGERSLRVCVEVNLIAVMLLAREAIKGMLSRGGSLVFVSSVAARTGMAGLAVYGATKGGLVSFSRAIAREYGEKGIRSNCVLPGYLETDMTRGQRAAVREQVVRRTALKRIGQTADVVGAVSFLLSEEARFITGTELVVDGGMST